MRSTLSQLASFFLHDREDPRARKLLTLVAVCLVSCVVPTGLYVWLDMPLPVLSNALVCVVGVVTLALMRGGARVGVSATVFLLGVLLVVVPFALMSTRDFALLVLAWLALYPLSASALGGPRVGLVVFCVMVVLFPLLVLALHAQVLPTLLDDPRFSSAPAHMLVLVVMCISTFVIGRGYELENGRRVAQLDAQNQRLVEAQRVSDVAVRARTQFLATISHELRTPLNGLIGMTAALKGEKRLERYEEGLHIFQTSADALLSVINDVLDFTKAEAGALDLERAPVNPTRIAREVLDVLLFRATERQNALSLEVAPRTVEWMFGDHTRLRQILFNLVGNATKFTERGHVRCLLSSDARHLRLEVVDDGVGMSPETVARLGEPFVQADASTTRKYGGTGLGLAITRRLVDAMGGKLEIDSAVGQGSRFRVTLPCESTSAPRVDESRRAHAPSLEVLVVDDNSVNQLVAQRLLERMGHHPTVVGDGQAAVERVATQRFDLVLMDCHMPVMDGFEATRILRARGFTVPVFALTALASEGDEETCSRAGMDGVLRKPLRVEQLEAVLARASVSKAA
ncbi:MAG: response regulator [Archangium sp.]|nr:response regulator [Archangium sp.]